jgi:hypothetical protein
MMSLSLLAFPTSLGAATAFVTGGLAGGLFTRLVRQSRAGSKLVLASSDLSPRFSTGVVSRISKAVFRRPSEASTPVLTKRMKAGRLPLPQRVTELTPADEPGLAPVDTFADEMSALPVEKWLEVGRTLVADEAAASRRATAIAALEATIDRRGLGVTAWYVRDAVDTGAYLASHAVPRWTSADRRIFAAAHGAAEDAALALLARDHVAPADFEVLFAPFAQCLPTGRITEARVSSR